MNRMNFALVLLGLLAPLAPAQQVWVVDDSGGAGVDFFNVQGAVNAAVDGDTILVRAGDQPSFIIDGKSLTVTADAGAAVHVAGFRVRNLSASQSATVIGLGAGDSLSFQPGVEVLKVTNCAGPVLIQDCVFAGDTLFALAPILPTVTISNAVGVTFERCSLFGRTNTPTLGNLALTAAALSSNASQVQLAHCDVTGASGMNAQPDGAGVQPGTPGDKAITLTTTRLILLGTTVSGGIGGNGTSTAGPACTSGESGGTGIASGDAACEVVTRASSVDGGAGGMGGPTHIPGVFCPSGPAGPATTGPGLMTALAGDSQPLDIAPAVVREGGAGTLQLHGTPGAGALLLVGFGQSQFWLPGHGGVLLPSAALLILPVGAVPGSGTLALPYSAPALPLGVEGLPVILQSAFTGGGPAILGGGGALVILDAAL